MSEQANDIKTKCREFALVLYGDEQRGIEGLLKRTDEIKKDLRQLQTRYTFALGGIAMFQFILGIFLVFLRLHLK